MSRIHSYDLQNISEDRDTGRAARKAEVSLEKSKEIIDNSSFHSNHSEDSMCSVAELSESKVKNCEGMSRSEIIENNISIKADIEDREFILLENTEMQTETLKSHALQLQTRNEQSDYFIQQYDQKCRCPVSFSISDKKLASLLNLILKPNECSKILKITVRDALRLKIPPVTSLFENHILRSKAEKERLTKILLSQEDVPPVDDTIIRKPSVMGSEDQECSSLSASDNYTTSDKNPTKMIAFHDKPTFLDRDVHSVFRRAFELLSDLANLKNHKCNLNLEHEAARRARKKNNCKFLKQLLEIETSGEIKSDAMRQIKEFSLRKKELTSDEDEKIKRENLEYDNALERIREELASILSVFLRHTKTICLHQNEKQAEITSKFPRSNIPSVTGTTGMLLSVSLSEMTGIAMKVSSKSNLISLILQQLAKTEKEFEEKLIQAEIAKDAVETEKNENREHTQTEIEKVININYYDKVRYELLKQLDAALYLCKARISQAMLLRKDPSEEVLEQQRLDLQTRRAAEGRHVSILENQLYDTNLKDSQLGGQAANAILKRNEDQNKIFLNEHANKNLSIRNQFEKHHAYCYEIIKTEKEEKQKFLRLIESDIPILEKDYEIKLQENLNSISVFEQKQLHSFEVMSELEAKQQKVWDQLISLMPQLSPFAEERHKLVIEHLDRTEKEYERRRIFEDYERTCLHHRNKILSLKELLEQSIFVLDGASDVHNTMAQSVIDAATSNTVKSKEICSVPPVDDLDTSYIFDVNDIIQSTENGEENDLDDDLLMIKLIKTSHERTFLETLYIPFVITTNELLSRRQTRLILSRRTLRLVDDLLSGVSDNNYNEFTAKLKETGQSIASVDQSASWGLDRQGLQKLKTETMELITLLEDEATMLAFRVEYYKAFYHLITKDMDKEMHHFNRNANNIASSSKKYCPFDKETFASWEIHLAKTVQHLHEVTHYEELELLNEQEKLDLQKKKIKEQEEKIISKRRNSPERRSIPRQRLFGRERKQNRPASNQM